MKKFEDVAMNENNFIWENAIKRERDLPMPTYGENALRSEFERDYTRIISSNAYRRQKHKTQVFFSPDDDHICTRIEHVNLVDSISYTIANELGLNTELTKAIAVGHDLGHTPFGHQGEKILAEIAKREYEGEFWHAKNSLEFVDNLELLSDYEGKKRNLSLTYAVRDGIISHSGSFPKSGLKPRTEYIDLNFFNTPGKYMPYTWEGCIVKIADNISYIGRDIEDALSMGILKDKDVEKFNKLIEQVKINSNNIINYLVVDLCTNSNKEEGLKFSDEAYEIMHKLIEFNNENIYKHPILKPMVRYCTLFMNELFVILKNEFDGENTIKNLKKMKKYYPELSIKFVEWLSNYSNIDIRENKNYDNKIIFDISKEKEYYRAIITYLSGMTDKYIVKMYNTLISI